MFGSVLTAIVSWLLICLPAWFIQDSTSFSAPAGILSIAVLFSALHEIIGGRQDSGREPSWTDAQFVLTLISIAVCWALQQFHLTGLWDLN
jgi:hypothetical protein